MPAGKYHFRATLILTAVSGVVCYRYGLSQWHTLGIATGTILTPDLDVDKGCISHKIVRSIPVVGVPLVKLWTWYWTPYGKIAKHRSVLSHTLFGSIIRFCYAFWWYALMPRSHLYYAYVVGLMISDAAHIIMDIATEIIEGIKNYH